MARSERFAARRTDLTVEFATAPTFNLFVAGSIPGRFLTLADSSEDWGGGR